MMDRHLTRRMIAVAMGTGVVAALATPSGAAAFDTSAGLSNSLDPAAERIVDISDEMREAMARDLELPSDEVDAQIAGDKVASEVADNLRHRLDDTFAGAWIEDGQLTVAVTDDAQFDQLRVIGVEPTVVTHSLETLDGLRHQLDDAARPDHREITGWYVDVPSNTVVVRATPGAEAAADEFIEQSGVAADAVRVEISSEQPRLLYDVRGGDAYYPGSSRCSVGFSVEGGFVTAGHCGGVGTSTSGYNQVSQGTVQGSNFPGADSGWVSVNSNWNTPPWVNDYDGGNVTVNGSDVAAIGASVCRSGSTTSWHCGQIEAYNQTVNYAQGTVYGLTRTSVCAEPGDSGGSFIAGDQAQGVTSGGSGNCSFGGTTYYQPVNDILDEFNLTLITGDNGGGTPPPPPPPPASCDDYNNVFSWYLTGTGDYDYEPNGSYFHWDTPGLHEGCLDGPSNADFDLYLQQFNGGWTTVASSTTPDSQEELTYEGSAGYYRYVVYSYYGSGDYTVGINVP